MESELLSTEAVDKHRATITRILEQMDRILLGRHDLHSLVLTGMLSRGHILLEGLPGLGKTALIHALGQILDLEFKRVQFTPDLMPGDILGTHILQEQADGKRSMFFQPGPVFCNILLADEINRASPKTQSALLETMQERSVTLLGKTRKLPRPFFVLASQNPIELEGTYPLPEAQLDRFLFKVEVGGLDTETLARIVQERRHGAPPSPEWTINAEGLEELFGAVDSVFLPEAVANYTARLVDATHSGSDLACEPVRNYIQYGASPRAAIGMVEAARAAALLAGRPTVGFEDIKLVAPSVLCHRLITNYQARFDRVSTGEIIQAVLDSLPVLDHDLPVEVVAQS